MKLENKATYSYTAIKECIEVVNQINTTVNKKADHFPKLLEIKKVFDFCYNKTSCCLFDTKYTIYEDYLNAIELGTNKKELDKLLKFCKRYLQNELIAIYKSMQSNECNTIA